MKSIILNNGNSLNVAGVNLDNNTAESPCQCAEYQFGQVLWIFEMDTEFNIVNQKCFKKSDINDLFYFYPNTQTLHNESGVWGSSSCVPNIKDIFYLNGELTFHFLNGAFGGGDAYNYPLSNYYYPTNNSAIVKFNSEDFNFYNPMRVPVRFYSNYKIIDKIFEINESKLAYLYHSAEYTSDSGTINDTASQLHTNGFQTFVMQEFNGELSEYQESNGNYSLVYISEIFSGNSDEVILDYKQDSPNSLTLLVVANSLDGLYSSGIQYETSLYHIIIDFSDISNLQYSVTRSNLNIPYNTDLAYRDYKVFIDNNNNFVFKLKCTETTSQSENKLHFLYDNGSFNSVNLDMDYQLDFDHLLQSGDGAYYINDVIYPNAGQINGTGYGRKIKDIYFDDDNFVTLEEVSQRYIATGFQSSWGNTWQVVKLYDYAGNVLSRNFFTDLPDFVIDYNLTEEIDYIFNFDFNFETFYSINKFGSRYLIDNFRNATSCEGSHTINMLELYSSLSTPDNYNSEISIFPNPSSNLVFIKGTNTELEVLVFDLSGKQVMREYITDKFDISCLEKGVYILQLSDGDKLTTQRIIKN